MYKVGLLLFTAVVILAAVGVSWVGLHTAHERLYSRNPRFTITKIDIVPGAKMSERLIRSWIRVEEGMNLFAPESDIRQIHKRLAECPNAKSVVVSRVLPGTLRVAVTERTPLARIGTSDYTVDCDGVIFRFEAGLGVRRVATIHGYTGTVEQKRSVHGTAWAAIELLEECDNPELGVAVQSVSLADIQDGLRVRLVFERVPRLVDIAWDDMGRRSEPSRVALQAKLDQVITVLQPRDGRVHTHIDATYKDQVVAVN